MARLEVTTHNRHREFTIFTLICSAAWTAVCLTMQVVDSRQMKGVAREVALTEARTYFKRDLAFRHWVEMQGGVYVPVTAQMQPNSQLANVPDRDIETTSGMKLTLVSPVYAINQLHQDFGNAEEVDDHITSLKPLMSRNAPDPWEIKALESFEGGVHEVSELMVKGTKPYLRYMSVFNVQKGCLKCHEGQGYEVGDVRGGMSLYIPMTSYLKNQRATLLAHQVSLGILWLMGLTGIVLGVRRLKVIAGERDRASFTLQRNLAEARDRLELEVADRTAELEAEHENLKRAVGELKDALAKVKTLSGVIPICMHCKKIRDDTGYWNKLEAFIQDHSSAAFSHSLCPDCLAKYYPEKE